MMIYHYKGIGGCDCKCGIEIHKNLGIATDIPENEGTAVTNWAEHLATQICKEFQIEPSQLIWIEHYLERGMHGERDESWDLAVFKLKEKTEFVSGKMTVSTFSAPVWHHLDKETVQGLIDAHTTKPETLKHWTDKVKAIMAKKEQAGNTGLPSSYFQ